MIPDVLNANLDLLTAFLYNPGRLTSMPANTVQQIKFPNNMYDLMIIGWEGTAFTTGGTEGEGTLFNVANDNNQNWFENPISFSSIFNGFSFSSYGLTNFSLKYLAVPYPLNFGQSLTVSIYAGTSGTDYAEIAFWCVAFRQTQRLPAAISPIESSFPL